MPKPLTPDQLCGKCGGCAHWEPVWTPFRGVCRLGPIRPKYLGRKSSAYRQQSQKACGRYEGRIENDQ